VVQNRSTTINELVEIMNKFMEEPLKPIYKKPRKGDILHSYLDNKKAKEVLGWVPDYSLEDGPKETIEYYRLKYASDEVAAMKEK
jgi:UDP-glucose 4-epimerase